ncbi:hypothetical protein MKZ38_000616 [Zalerion maritima]|uniref:Uncharacterized protein n=1 Tax=Zalerion maritima TaxID=339359 RepID=A0AAD5RSP4_9PEZI|nr:hypothetical protein MKZ38_000616 [Zalerion maritima]
MWGGKTLERWDQEARRVKWKRRGNSIGPTDRAPILVHKDVPVAVAMAFLRIVKRRADSHSPTGAVSEALQKTGIVAGQRLRQRRPVAF